MILLNRSKKKNDDVLSLRTIKNVLKIIVEEFEAVDLDVLFDELTTWVLGKRETDIVHKFENSTLRIGLSHGYRRGCHCREMTPQNVRVVAKQSQRT